MLNVKASCPTRIDLMGGTLDLWPVHHLLAKKATLNFGVDLCAEVSISERSDGQFAVESLDQGIKICGSLQDLFQASTLPLVSLILEAIWQKNLPGLDVKLECGSPKGAGLGGSSSLAICLAAALSRCRRHFTQEPEPSERQLVETVQNIEAKLLGMPAGCQDHWGAVRGQVTLLTYPYKGVDVETFLASDFPEIDEQLLLVHSGISRFSGMNNWELYKKLIDGNSEVLDRFEALGAIASEARDCLVQQEWSKIMELSQQDWQVRKTLCPEIETVKTKQIDLAAINEGAYFSRVCGAGGGGVLAVFAPAKRHPSIIKAVEEVGGIVLEAGLSHKGLQIFDG